MGMLEHQSNEVLLDCGRPVQLISVAVSGHIDRDGVNRFFRSHWTRSGSLLS